MCDPDLCNEQYTATVKQQDIQNGHFSCFSFSVNHLDFFFSPLEIVPPLLCVLIIQVSLTLIPKLQEWLHDQGQNNWSILTLGQSPWLVDGPMTDQDQEGQ